MIRHATALVLAAPLLFLGSCAGSFPVESMDSAGLLARAESSPSRAVLLNFWASW